jgi:hypothetical protein
VGVVVDHEDPHPTSVPPPGRRRDEPAATGVQRDFSGPGAGWPP